MARTDKRTPQATALTGERGRDPPGAPLELELLQAGPALGVRQLHERVTVQVEEVEDRIDDRHAGGKATHRVHRTARHASHVEIPVVAAPVP